MTDALLFVTYFLVATPIGWVRRLIRDPLSRRSDRRATTYWIASDRRE